MKLEFALHWALRYRGRLAMISLLSVLSSGATLAIPWLVGQFVGGLVGDEAMGLETTIILLGAALVVLATISVMVAILSESAAGRILAGLREATYERVQAMPIAFHDAHRSGDLLALMTNEVDSLSNFLTATLARVPGMLLTAGGAVILLFLIDPMLALVIPVLVPLFYIALKLVGRNLRGLALQLREAEVGVIAAADSDLSMLPAIKAFAVEEHHSERYRSAVEKARRLALRQARISAFIGPTVGLVAAGAAIAILAIGSSKVESGVRSPSELFAFLLYAALLTRPVGSLANIYGQFQMARGTLERLESVFSEAIEPGYLSGERLDRARGAIDLRGVSFSYPGRPPVLKKLDLTISAGEIVALTGENGIGKSTLVRLLLRYYDPDSGTITLDGTDISSLQVQDLRRQFGYVPQRALLFNGTVAENIAFGIPDASLDQIERAARMAQAWEFIERLPDGFATQIGDNGVRLSGGQRQRIALARALLRDPPIYIFDEATSMYDLEGEAAFVEAAVRMLKDRTVIIITHRPASLALADRVLGPEELGYALHRAARSKDAPQ